jgi:hypothetical protein
METTYREFGALVVSTNKALTDVVDQILANTGAESPTT